MFEYAWKNIVRRKLRSCLTVTGIMIMLGVVMVISEIVDYQQKVMQQHAAASVGRIIIQSFLAGNQYPAASVDLPEKTANGILQRQDIQNAISGKVVFYALEQPLYPNEPPALLLAGVEIGKERAFTGSVAQETRVSQGAGSFSQVKNLDAVILGRQARFYFEKKAAHKLALNEQLEILGSGFMIVGFLEPSPDKAVDHSVIMPLSAAQRLLGKQGFVSSVIVYPQRVTGKAAIIHSLRNMDPLLRFVTSETITRNAAEGIKVFENMIRAVKLAVLGGTIILLVTIMLLNIKERVMEIGILRAVGVQSFHIILTIFWEISFLSLLGCLAGGVLVGLVLRFGLTENLFSVQAVLKYIPWAFAVALPAGILPAMRITKIEPIDAMRHE